MGIFFDGADNNGTIDSTRTGLIKVGKDSLLKINLQDGNSAAIYADDIDVLTGGIVDITTAQNTTSNGAGTMNGFLDGGLGGIHNGVVNLGMHGIKSRALRIAQDATFKINRTSDKSSSALLSFGGTGSDGGCTSSVLVNGGTLDLEDHATIYRIWNDGAIKNIPWTGLITMWGSGTTDNVDFEVPKLINLQRYGKSQSENGHTQGNTGAMLRLEGTNVSVDINKNVNKKASNVVTPLKFWNPQATSASNTWYIVKEHNQNSWGNKSSGYLKKGTTQKNLSKLFAPDGVATFRESNGSVTLSEDLSGKNTATFNDGTGDTSKSYMSAFLNDFNWWSPQQMSFGSDINMARDYTPAYKGISVNVGKSAITDAPTFTENGVQGTVATPSGTTFAKGTDAPSWSSIGADGKVTVSPTAGVTPGAYNVPVIVTYSDGSVDNTTVPVIVTKAGQSVVWGDRGAVVLTTDTSKFGAHETTTNSQVLSPAGAVTAVSYELTDGKLSETATPITIAPSTVRWTKEPSTIVDTASADGTQIKDNTIQIDFTNNSAVQNILGSKNGTVTTSPFDIVANGAGAKNVTNPVEVKLGSELTPAQFKQLVVNKIPTKQIASTTWATKPDAQGKGGVIKITFTDKDANGNPTYLNVDIPASSIKITTDADANTPAAKNISTQQDQIPSASDAITNKPTDNVSNKLPEGTTISWTDSSQIATDVKTPGEYHEMITVTYPDGSTDTVTSMVTVDAKPTVKTIETTVGEIPNAKDGISNLNNGGKVYPSDVVWTTEPDTSKVGDTTGKAKVTYPDKTTQDITIPVHVAAKVTDADKYEPKGQNITVNKGAKAPSADTAISNKDALPAGTQYSWQTTPDTNTVGDQPATVVVTYPDGSHDTVNVTVTVKNNTPKQTDADKYQPQGQDVNTHTGETPNPADGIKNKDDLPKGTNYTWQTTPDTTIPGSKPATIVVTYPDGSHDTVNVTVTVKDNTPKQTDADKYEPQGKNITVNKGAKAPSADTAISNKDALPAGTQYSWQTTPDTNTVGDQPATVVVTYPDGSHDTVNVTVTVKNNTPKQTDADKYQPQGQDVNTHTGETPNPADGIKNKDDLPKGTNYTWQTTPDTTTPGNKPATIVVTYPDGSTDKVTVTIHVTNPQTDADKYEPQGKNITVNKGAEVPGADTAISNKGDLPANTQYSWQTTPDTNTVGDQAATVVVTYPDGSHDTINVTVTVKDNTPKQTDADKYQPQGQDVNTHTGETPNPADGIKNKGDLPKDTTYTWKDTSDITTSGDKQGTIVINYPDGSKDEVSVTIHVTPFTPQQGGQTTNHPADDVNTGSNINNGGQTNGSHGNAMSEQSTGSQTNNSQVNTIVDNNQHNQTLPQTGNQHSMASVIVAALAGVISLLGLAGHKKED